MKKECKVCGCKFQLDKKNKYEVAVTKPSLFGGNFPVVYECFDCPKCGCQNMLNIREVGKYADKIEGMLSGGDKRN